MRLVQMSNNGGRPGSPHLISFDDGDGFEDNFGKDVCGGYVHNIMITCSCGYNVNCNKNRCSFVSNLTYMLCCVKFQYSKH